MIYDITYVYENGRKDLLVRRNYKSDLEAYTAEVQRALANNVKLDKVNISTITIYRGYMSKGERRWKTIVEQHFNGNELSKAKTF